MSLINGSDFWNIIILLGSVQGFILSFLVWKGKGSSKLSNRLLATLIFLLALACSNLYISESGMEEEYPTLQVIQQLLPLILIMPVGPLIYFYVQSVTEVNFQLDTKRWLHFLPTSIDLFPKLLVWIALAGLLMQQLQEETVRGWSNFIDAYNTYMDIPRWLSLTVYILVARHYLIRKLPSQAESDNSQRKWLRQFLNAFLLFQGIWLLFLIPYINPSTRNTLLDDMSYYPIYIPLAILVYWLGFKSYIRIRLQTEAPPSQPETIAQQPMLVTTPSFTSEEITDYINSLRKVMEKEKLYLEPTLHLQMLATHTAIPQKTISYILNNYLHKSFNEFINEYRIEEVKKRLLEKDNTHLTIVGIALDCGFNSQATFQRAFKNSTGVSPREYLSIQSQESV
ncbi:helix-turn-helix domain-containing protein [Cytophagaceae bacterium YF14B1]|uniref:Helix-turn-helix domain-containing protein n=1 Tax=Xanthocytophaga flava TaxID=3048013 RepID=A0AAE3UAM4_9BACT|nr:helix-turn-helix domain-containing protein [Xanthocytophaga flavus]MDJ1482914.1 helix-turn-helix domain-containing protein [Xanthocytophaga flavus]